MHLKIKTIVMTCWQLFAKGLHIILSHNWSDIHCWFWFQMHLIASNLMRTDTELIRKTSCFGGQGGQNCPLAPSGQSINLRPAGAGADPLHSLTEHRPAPNACFTLPLLWLSWWCSHYWVTWGVICHFCLIELENLLSLVHLQQRGVDALQMRGISFPCSLLHGNLIRFCMTDHCKQQKVWRSVLLEPDKRNTRIKTSREQKEHHDRKVIALGQILYLMFDCLVSHASCNIPH